MVMISEFSPSIELVELGQPTSETTWLVSDWNAGQSTLTQWSPDNVRVAADGSIEFVLSASPDGSARPYQGGEIQSSANAETGTWAWQTQAPDMVDGAVYGLFLYKSDWQNDPVLEFDFEFVGADTTSVEINIHMQDAAGKYITLAGGPLVVDLWFDAAEGVHLYEIELTGTSAIFRIDGVQVAEINASHMPGDTWYTGEVKGFVDLWAVSPEQEQWAGVWDFDGTPLVGVVTGIGHPGDPLVLDVPLPLEPDPELPAEPALPEETDPEGSDPVDPVPVDPIQVEPVEVEPAPIEPEPVDLTPEPSPKGNNGKGSRSDEEKGGGRPDNKKTASTETSTDEVRTRGHNEESGTRGKGNQDDAALADTFIFVQTTPGTRADDLQILTDYAVADMKSADPDIGFGEGLFADRWNGEESINVVMKPDADDLSF